MCSARGAVGPGGLIGRSDCGSLPCGSGPCPRKASLACRRDSRGLWNPAGASPLSRARPAPTGFESSPPSPPNKKGVPFGTPFLFGGEGGIRTLDTRKRIHAFQACSFSHSDTSPKLIVTTSWPRSGSRTRACSLLGLTPSPLRGRHRYAATFACLRQGVSHSDTSPKLAALSHHQRARRVPEGRGSGKRGGVTQALSVLFLAR